MIWNETGIFIVTEQRLVDQENISKKSDCRIQSWKTHKEISTISKIVKWSWKLMKRIDETRDDSWDLIISTGCVYGRM